VDRQQELPDLQDEDRERPPEPETREPAGRVRRRRPADPSEEGPDPDEDEADGGPGAGDQQGLVWKQHARRVAGPPAGSRGGGATGMSRAGRHSRRSGATETARAGRHWEVERGSAGSGYPSSVDTGEHEDRPEDDERGDAEGDPARQHGEHGPRAWHGIDGRHVPHGVLLSPFSTRAGGQGFTGRPVEPSGWPRGTVPCEGRCPPPSTGPRRPATRSCSPPTGAGTGTPSRRCSAATRLRSAVT